jgi:hypothetical protein
MWVGMDERVWGGGVGGCERGEMRKGCGERGGGMWG